MKGKIAMTITIGIICILLTSVMFLQFKTVQVIEESGVGAMRESELREEYAEVKLKSEELRALLEETEKSIAEYNSQSTDNQGTVDLLKADVEKAKCDLGYTNVKGPGLIITISDGTGETTDDTIKYYDLIFAINELKFAGAEAISINDERLVNASFIAKRGERFIVTNGQIVTSPYVIKVIGDTKYLESVINIKGGLKDYIESEGKKISYTVENEVYINKYDDLIEINFGE